MLHSDKNVQECDTTGLNSSIVAKYKRNIEQTNKE